MNLGDYLSIGRRHRRQIVLIVLAFVALMSAVTLTSTPQYSSTTRLFVSTSGGDENTAYQGGLFSQGRVKSYADLIGGEAISQRVVDSLGLDESASALSSQVTATSSIDTVILSIKVTDPSPERARILADAFGQEFITYVAELETPPGKDEATVKASIVDKATKASSPISPNPVRNILLGIIIGLIIGYGIAVLRETLDTTVKSMDDIEEFLDAPLLGAIMYDSDAVDTPLITALGSYAPRVEAFRVLRTNLQFIDPDQINNVFTITSALPGEGKSSTATNLAIALAEGGSSVVLVEGDMRRPRVHEYLKLERNVGLTTVLVGRATLDDAIQQSSVVGLDVLTSGQIPPNPAELIKSAAMADTMEKLRSRYDVVLIDATPLLPVTDGALLADLSDGAILVIHYGKTTLDQARGAVERLESVDAETVGVVLNMTPKPTRGDKGYGYGYGYGYAPDAKTPAPAAKTGRLRRGSKRR